MHRKGLLGFSLVEILLVLALLGLVSSVCVVHFEVIQNAFSQGNSHPVKVLSEAIKQGRLLASQNHCNVNVVLEEKSFDLRNDEGEVLQKFPFISKNSTIKWFAGELSSNGTFKSSDAKVKTIEINADAFIKSTFVEILQEDGKECYEVDILTGELKAC